MIIEAMLAIAIWSYNLSVIARRARGREDRGPSDNDKGGENDNCGNTLTNSIDAIRYIRQLKHIERMGGKRAHEEAYYRQ